MSKYLIETDGLSKRFDTLLAVDNVNLKVRSGEILALLGPNGAGKTTTIRMLASILNPSEGQARVAGYSVAEQPEEVRRRVGLLTEHHGLYTRMRSVNYLKFFGSLYQLPEDELGNRIEGLLDELGLAEAKGIRLGHYSRGMRQKLVLARALLHDPQVLLLDEPTSAMDPSSARMVRRSIVGLRSSDRGIIVCTHNLAEAEALADRIAIIRRGRIIANGTPAELKQQLLGDPIMELRFSGVLNGAIENFPASLRLVGSGTDWLRYRTSEPTADNPTVLRAMETADVDVVTLSEVGRTMEEVYLEVVESADQAEVQG
ncbi:MAG: ABC transporter ATP-binding protein [Anaerolineales bacterium]